MRTDCSINDGRTPRNPSSGYVLVLLALLLSLIIPGRESPARRLEHLSPVLGTWSYWENPIGVDPTQRVYGFRSTVTPWAGQVATLDWEVPGGLSVEEIATATGVDLDLIAHFNNISYVVTTRRNQSLRVPLLRTDSEEIIPKFVYQPPSMGGSTHRFPGGPANSPKFKTHVVSRGETLWGIARRYGIDVETIIGTNDLKTFHLIHPGLELRVPDRKGVMVAFEEDSCLDGILEEYDISLVELFNANPGIYREDLAEGLELFIPGGKPFEGLGRFILPVYGRITSRFGSRKHPILGGVRPHTGVDIAKPHGTYVKASQEGRVTFAGWKGGYGKVVILKHQGGYETVYAHNSSILVRPGQYVSRGQAIARVGSTGLSTGPHVHFEIKKNGRHIDPLTLAF
jgi:murein DD-endopeptidase MepM/ murein hydrolase activator NlpD